MIKWNKQTRRRFYEKVKPEGDCLVWTGSVDKNGYPRCLSKSFGSAVAHRAVYLQKHGPTNLPVDHLCSNRKCVKLSHLEAVTQAENVYRSKVTKRTKTYCANGHTITPATTMWDNGYFKCRVCDRERAKRRYYRNKQLFAEAAFSAGLNLGENI